VDEGLKPYIVDDVTWWVDIDRISISPQDSQANLKDVRPWVATLIGQMKHCSPQSIQHALRPTLDYNDNSSAEENNFQIKR
jgi:hypothetical protein